ncbi:MAG: hypothetical protein HYV95_11925 [Opitutae bacterium]|nr:hypothetical protein [Opitutae bacterium]
MSPSRHSVRFLRVASALLAAALLGGCAGGPAINDPVRVGPFFAPRNFAGDKTMPATIRRVLVLPVCGGNLTEPEAVAALDPVILTTLQRQQRFEVVPLSREECAQRFGAREFSSAGALPHGFLEQVGRYYAADAVLFVDLTVYQPYRPLGLGFRAKLATVQDVRLIWSFDEIFSVTNPAVVNAVRRFHLQEQHTTPPVDLSVAALQSPGRFAAYAADTMFATLPPR